MGSLLQNTIFGKTKNSFVSTWTTSNIATGSSTANQIKLPLVASGTYNFVVDWGDGTKNTITIWNHADTTHTYAVAGNYTIKITGICTGWTFNNTGDRLKILTVISWGTAKLFTTGANFAGCTNLTLTTVKDVPIGITVAANMFLNCTSLTTINKISDWNMRSITNFSAMFNNCTNFDGDLSFWDVSNSTSFIGTFQYCTKFNNGGSSGINNWNTSNVTNLTSMFQGCSLFNQPIGNWDVSNCTSFARALQNCSVFNQNIGAWNVTKSSSFQNLISNGFAFNNGGSSSINNWVLNSTTPFSLSATFSGCTVFNQPLYNWNTSQATDMNNLFNLCTSFNQNLGSWNIGNVRSMSSTFRTCRVFNNLGSDTIKNWNTSNVTIMQDTFANCDSFNQPIGNWNTSKVATMMSMFVSAYSFNQNIGAWDVSKVQTFNQMFQNATSFNNGGSPDINNWNTISATDMSSMFYITAHFNQPLGNWNTSNVTTMNAMFRLANAFNQNIGAWNVSKVSNFFEFMTSKTAANYSATNLNAIYNGWSSRPVIPGVAISFNTIKYTAASAAGRTILTGSPNSWSITDGGV